MRGQTVLITGATSGIGRATAVHCGALGANVVAAGRRAEMGEALVQEIEQAGGTACFIKTDVTREEDVAATIAATLERFGALDFAFNNAGIFHDEPGFHEYDNQMWDKHLGVGLTGVFRRMKHELVAMLAQPGDKHRSIVNNASTVGMRGSTASGAGYTAVKHGIIGLTRQAAVEYASTPIRINAICPGPTLTEATAPLLDQDPETRRAFLSTLNPTATLIEADDIAATFAFLCSDAARMINGQTLPMDGGQLAQL